ncbi:MAG TPA: Crp/Fnr family transcriptional regulator [Microvirga sp.]|nr:Crp/Fnr family transcriptional regulator [Microvirga sp.]
MSPATAHPLVEKLESITDLSPAERGALAALPMRVQDVRADLDLVREGDHPTQCCLVLEGFTCRYKFTDTGKRQIFAFHTPGDIPDLQSLHLKTMDHSLGTITPCRLAFIQHADLRELFRQHPRLADAFWRDTLIDAAIFREWMLGIGRRSAKARLAHFLCEMVMRLVAIGRQRGNAVPLPITQAEVGDALGLSTVHVNRTLQELREEGLLTWDNGILAVLNWERLKEVGEFDPNYLHQDPGHVARAG